MKSGPSEWRIIARKLSNVPATIFLTLFYFTLVAPFGLGARWLSDLLHVKAAGRIPTWARRGKRGSDPAEMRRQY